VVFCRRKNFKKKTLPKKKEDTNKKKTKGTENYFGKNIEPKTNTKKIRGDQGGVRETFPERPKKSFSGKKGEKKEN